MPNNTTLWHCACSPVWGCTGGYLPYSSGSAQGMGKGRGLKPPSPHCPPAQQRPVEVFRRRTKGQDQGDPQEGVQESGDWREMRGGGCRYAGAGWCTHVLSPSPLGLSRPPLHPQSLLVISGCPANLHKGFHHLLCTYCPGTALREPALLLNTVPLVPHTHTFVTRLQVSDQATSTSVCWANRHPIQNG